MAIFNSYDSSPEGKRDPRQVKVQWCLVTLMSRLCPAAVLQRITSLFWHWTGFLVASRNRMRKASTEGDVGSQALLSSKDLYTTKLNQS